MADPTSEARSLPNIEGLRLIASCAIVAHHYLQYLNWNVEGLPLAVDLFFVISGIVIAMVYETRVRDFGGYRSFIRKRIARLYPLHLATLAFYVAIGVLIALGKFVPASTSKYDTAEIVPNLLMIHAWFPHGHLSYNYASWSISAEFFVYLLFPVILFVVSRGFAVGFAWLLVTSAGAVAIGELVFDKALPELTTDMGCLRAVPSFSLGVWTWIHRGRLLSWFRGFEVWILSAGTIALVVEMAVLPDPHLMLLSVDLIVVGAFLCDAASIATIAAWKPISSRGYLTYSIYMLHLPVATVVISFLGPKILGTASQGAVVATVGIAAIVTYVAARMSYRWFETPLRRLIGG